MSDMTQEQVTATWSEINEINCALEALSASAASNILRRDAVRLNREHEAQAATYRRKLMDLHAQLPPTGEASGQHMVFAKTLGTVYVRASEPELPPDDGYDPSDPYARYEREAGIFRDE